MQINGNYGNNGIYNLYSSLYSSNMSMFNNKLGKSLFPTNAAQGKDKLGTSAIGYVTNLKTSSKALSGAIKTLSGAAFSGKTMVSSDSEAMTVSYAGSKTQGPAPLTVKITQTAAAQKNEGSSMDAAAKYEGPGGINRFSIEAGGKTTQLSVSVSAGDTNQTVQQKMANAINLSGIGVKATVETDSKNGTSVLKLESAKTGGDPKNAFTIKDVTGELVGKTGVGSVTSAGRDAIYSVNGGEERTSQSNTVDLGNGISATLLKVTDKEITVSQGKDTTAIKNAIEDMVKSYNDLYSEAAQRTTDKKAQSLASRMVNTSKVYSGSLANIGIGFDSDGRMKINAEQLDKAAESGKLEKFFTENSGKNYGFTNQLSKLADNVARNTSNFVDSKQFGADLSENFAYSSFGDLIQYSFLSAGSIFDYSF